MKVYIIEDDDTGECRAYQDRNNAIDIMYFTCKNWGAILYLPGTDMVELQSELKTDEEILKYLYGCTEEDLNEIFECYWNFQTLELN